MSLLDLVYILAQVKSSIVCVSAIHIDVFVEFVLFSMCASQLAIPCHSYKACEGLCNRAPLCDNGAPSVL